MRNIKRTDNSSVEGDIAVVVVLRNLLDNQPQDTQTFLYGYASR